MHDSLVSQLTRQVRRFMLTVNSNTLVLIQHACKTTRLRTDMMLDTVFRGAIGKTDGGLFCSDNNQVKHGNPYRYGENVGCVVDMDKRSVGSTMYGKLLHVQFDDVSR